jgi:hypothetical protein
MAKKNWLKGAAIVLIALLALAGCSGKKNSDGGGSSGDSGAAKASSSKSSGGGKANPASDFRYDLTKDGKGVVIEDWLGKNGGKVVIPAEIEGYPVVAIAASAFWENDSKDEYKMIEAGKKRITGIVIPDTVTDIVPPKDAPGFGAVNVFMNCISLKDVTLSKNLKNIAASMFYNCSSLTTITIPESVTTIEEGAFYKCSELAEVKLPSHPIKYTGDVWPSAFGECPKLSLATRKAIQDSGYKGDF